MPPRRKRPSTDKRAELLAEVERTRAIRQSGYRDKALALFPHVCARCGREFSGKRLRELTVHHIDHNHMNNPEDGSNWELLCLYCHDNEHAVRPNSGARGGATMERHGESSLDFRPFEVLKDLIQPTDDESNKD